MSAACRALPEGEVHAQAQAVAERVTALPAWRAARRIALYHPLGDELPTRPLYEAAVEAGLERCWHRMRGSGLELAVCAAWESLVPGERGVREPPAQAPQAALGPDLLILVPGRAFDRSGGRLGRGGGAYDRLLAARNGAVALGVGFDLQCRSEALPREAHDVPVDQVVTSRGVFG